MAEQKANNKTAVVTQEYVYKSIDKDNNKITCLDTNFNSVTFDLDPTNKDLLTKINKAITDGQKQKKDVKITVTKLTKNNKETQTVSDVKIEGLQNTKDKKQTEDVQNEDEKWPEDAPDDDEKKNDNNSDISVRIAAATPVDKGITNVVLELCGSVDKGRCPVDICAVLDVSGSMSSSAAVKEDDGSVKNDDGLSVLDLVKHSVKTIIHCLDSNDRFSIVAFSGDARKSYDLGYMKENGKKSAVVALEQLSAGGTTNIWDGLRVGMDTLREKQESGRLSVIMLLTDGQPNKIPPKGHIFELEKYIDTTNFAAQINTFGFGYDLDGKLLHDIAVYGNGTFAFIPDSLIVGTTFVNSVANVLTTVTAKTKLHLTPMNGCKFIGKSLGGHKESNESWGRIIRVGPIGCGSTRYISIPMSIPNEIGNKPFLECQVSGGILGARGKYNKTVIEAVNTKVANDLLAGHLTAKVVSIGMECIELYIKRKFDDAQKLIDALKKEIGDATDIAMKTDTDDFDQMSANSRLEALNNDVQGRLNKAFIGEPRFNRWGKYYLRALLRAHQLNMCTNFMDPGLQVNGGNLFRELRAKGDEVFINLPAPKPSRAPRNYNYGGGGGNNNNNRQRSPSPVNMTNYYGGCGGGCFAPYSCVVVMDFNMKQCMSKQCCDVRPGDMVQVVDGFAKVLLVVELARDKTRRMIELPGGLVITGGHPVRRNGLWCLPREQSDAVFVEGCDNVFTFVLDKSHVMIVNGMECVTWGHGINDCVVRNEFYGTDKVIKALQQKVMDIENNKGERIVENVDPLDNVIAIYQ